MKRRPNQRRSSAIESFVRTSSSNGARSTLEQAHEAGQIQFHGLLRALAQPRLFRSLIRQLNGLHWVAYCKPPFGGPDQVLRYLGAYTHRVAISNRRLVSFQDNQVTFRWRDSAHKNKNKKRLLTLPADEFLRRFLLRVLPRSFVRIRHFGFLASRRRGVLWASVPGNSPVAGNSVVSIDPATGNVIDAIYAGSEPGFLALSGDGSHLFATLGGAPAIASIDLSCKKRAARASEWRHAMSWALSSDCALTHWFYNDRPGTGISKIWTVNRSKSVKNHRQNDTNENRGSKCTRFVK